MWGRAAGVLSGRLPSVYQEIPDWFKIPFLEEAETAFKLGIKSCWGLNIQTNGEFLYLFIYSFIYLMREIDQFIVPLIYVVIG